MFWGVKGTGHGHGDRTSPCSAAPFNPLCHRGPLALLIQSASVFLFPSNPSGIPFLGWKWGLREITWKELIAFASNYLLFQGQGVNYWDTNHMSESLGKDTFPSTPSHRVNGTHHSQNSARIIVSEQVVLQIYSWSIVCSTPPTAY